MGYAWQVGCWDVFVLCLVICIAGLASSLCLGFAAFWVYRGLIVLIVLFGLLVWVSELCFVWCVTYLLAGFP